MAWCCRRQTDQPSTAATSGVTAQTRRHRRCRISATLAGSARQSPPLPERGQTAHPGFGHPPFYPLGVAVMDRVTTR